MAKKRERGNGTGTVNPRKNKQDKIISYHGPDGKRRYVSAKKKGECQRRLREAMTDADRGLIFDRPDLKLGEYLNSWLSDSVKDTVRQRTWERYESIVRVHIKPALGRVKLKDLTATHARSLYREKLESGSSPRTVQYIHTTLRKALQDAMSDGLMPRNVADGIKAPRPKRKEINPLSPEQARTFLKAVRGDRLEALYVLALHRGLRQGELLGLRWDDLDLEAGTLQVRPSYAATRGDRGFRGRLPGSGPYVPWGAWSAHAPLHADREARKDLEACGAS